MKEKPDSPAAYVGIDVSKATLDVAIYLPSRSQTDLPHRKFKNSEAGFSEILRWVCTKSDCSPSKLRIIMEPTHYYHLAAAHALRTAGCEIVVCNPHRARSYAVGIGKLNKSDRCDAKTLALFGTESRVRLWQPCPPHIIELRWILKRIQQLDLDIKRVALRGDAAQVGSAPGEVRDSIARSRTFQIEERRSLLLALEAFMDRHPTLCYERELLMTMPGIGPMAATHLLYLLRSRSFEHARDVAACVGVVPMHSTSGTSVNARTKISKAGDPRLRMALYMPALVMTRTAPTRDFYQKLLARGLKRKQGVIALMRKALQTAFGILKHGQPYDAAWEESRPSIPSKLAAPSPLAESITVGPARSRSTTPCSSSPPGARRKTLLNSVYITRQKGIPILLQRRTALRLFPPSKRM